MFFSRYRRMRRERAASIARLIDEVTGWKGIRGGKGRFRSYAFYYHGREIGHVHTDGFLDVEVPARVGIYLVEHGYAEPHRIYPHHDRYRSFRLSDASSVAGARIVARVAYWYCVYDTPQSGEDGNQHALPDRKACTETLPEELCDLLWHERS